MLGKGYLDNRDLGKFHRFSFGVELGEGVLFLLKVIAFHMLSINEEKILGQ